MIRTSPRFYLLEDGETVHENLTVDDVITKLKTVGPTVDSLARQLRSLRVGAGMIQTGRWTIYRRI